MGQRHFKVLKAFTLIELLVVIAIIALLISILLPSMTAARNQAKALVCGTSMRHVGQAFATFLAENNSVYPPSYIYPSGPGGEFDLENQPPSRPYGYLHWSWFLYSHGEVPDNAFECPSIPRGGAPRTDPGSRGGDWEAGQVDSRGDGNPNSLEDKQAPRMAFTANAAIVPRNKFTSEFSGGPRVNQLVPENRINTSRNVILVTELQTNWVTAGISVGAGIESKSHRPINPFYHLSSGANEYLAPLNTPGFMYGPPEDRETYGLRPLREIRDMVGVIDGNTGPETNAIGRHHPGGDKLGGTTNFLYIDGHVERKTVLKTMKLREWGDKYYSLTGRNEVLPGD